MKPHVENAPGLIWQEKGDGWKAIWRARADLVERGFSPKNRTLWTGVEPSPADAAYISDNCQRLQAEMLVFGRGAPAVWGAQLREALSEGFVTVGWGGILKLTDAGREARTVAARHSSQ